MTNKVFIAGSCRTAIGAMGGSLSSVPVAKLGEVVIKEALQRAGIDGKDVDMVYMGNILQAGQGQNVARQSSLNAGIPAETPAMTINIVCGSGLEAINMAANLIRLGEADIVVAGGMENMSASVYVLPQGRYGYRMGNGEILDTMVHDALTDAFHHYHMGVTAENICDQWGLNREELDKFALESQLKAKRAQEEGKFDEEIVPVEIMVKKNRVIFDRDEGIRPGTTLESLGSLRPAFKKEGMVTAGNSSTINDGAAAVVVISEKKAKELGVTIEAEWINGALAGTDPAIMGIGPVYSTQKLAKKMSISISDFDLIEANEAFASQSIAVLKELNLDVNKVNINGGAIALGHPVGASGCRILVSLIHEMKRRQEVILGLATLCIGLWNGLLNSN